ncbi:M23 family metallopeptidase [Streptomyces sp. YIM 130001]|uniref:M23 family metallopeptidase n=1 Tax=Streptomyces sp. YIM 130001 TaxID=2259644 RepID=UPI000E64B9B0|nr:M23 family metallopeptidase [Streptomyces sp. YIM 130001]
MNSSTEDSAERQSVRPAHHPDVHPQEPVTTRRGALGVTAALVGGALSIAAAPSAVAATRSTRAQAPGHAHTHIHTESGAAAESGEPCFVGYDEDFEDALEAADSRLPDDGANAQRAGLPGVFAKPLRRQYRVSARYGIKGNWVAGHHTGIDLAVPTGTPVYAAGGGTVVLAGWSGDYGNAVTVRMAGGHYAVYGHLSRVRTRYGATIKAGARIADSGSTGRATGPHLHLEIRSQRGYGSDVDPVAYLARRGVRLL